MLKNKMYEGNVYNSLKAIKFVGMRLSESEIRSFWEFQCACSNTCVKPAHRVVDGRMRHCGCKTSLKLIINNPEQAPPLPQDDAPIDPYNPDTIPKKREETYRKSRSDQYQFRFQETTVPMDSKCSISNTHFAPEQFNQELSESINDLNDKLNIEIYKLLREILTPTQYLTVCYLKEGYTQQETANFINVNQTSVNKVLKGSNRYKNGKYCKGQFYGGICKKVLYAIKYSDPIRSICQQINFLQERL